MSDAALAMFALPDLSGIVRGKSFAPARLADARRDGLAWVPANIAISPFGAIPPDNPFGAFGDIELRDAGRQPLTLPGDGPRASMDLHLAEIAGPDGEPWDCCPRGALKAAVAALIEEAGLTLKVAFEHEFTLVGAPFGADPSFSLAAIRRTGSFAADVDAVLRPAGIVLEQFVPEYGPGQFEIASTPADPLEACDQAVLSREAIRDMARRMGAHATFLPKPRLDQAGNGVHLHFSLWDAAGRAVLARDGWLAEAGGAFAAGVLSHAASLLLFTTGSANSFQRIRPRSWVGAYACAGERNREAMMRFCPRSVAGRGPLPKASLEFRVVDATANIYLALAALIRAGLDGVRRKLPPPANVTEDPASLDASTCGSLGILPLPASLGAALEAARPDDPLVAAFPPRLAAALLALRRADARLEASGDPAETAARLAAIY